MKHLLTVTVLCLSPILASGQETKTPAEQAFEASGAAYFYAWVSYEQSLWEQQVYQDVDAQTIAAKKWAYDQAANTFLLSIQAIESEAEQDPNMAQFAIATAAFYAEIAFQQAIYNYDPSDMGTVLAYDSALQSVQVYQELFATMADYYNSLIPGPSKNP